MTGALTVDVGGRKLRLSNLDKVLYPEVGLTKGEVLDYYTKIAPVLLPHLAGRPLTVKRYPDGVGGPSFFEKNAARGTPDWVRTVTLPVPGSTKNRDEISYVLVEELPTLVWLANLAALELHTPQWRVGPRGGVLDADQVVFDLDPGAPATIRECGRVALLLRDLLAADGLTAYPKTSGSKGMQLYVPVTPTPAERTSAYAHGLATRLATGQPGLVVSRMTKALRPGKVLVDWSQNNAAKTTVSVYSLRARELPSVSTPLSWDEVAQLSRNTAGPPPVFRSDEVLDRVAADGDLFAPLLAPDHRPRLPG